METMALMTLLLIMGGLAVGQSAVVQSTKTGNVGENVLLPCPCSDEANELVWQIGDRLVSHYTQNKNANSSIDESYVKRTQLFLNVEKGNCSLLLINLSVKDQGVYTCYDLTPVGDKTWSTKSSHVNLTVSENKMTDQDKQAKGPTALSSVHIGIPILLVVIILAAGLLLFKRRRQNKATPYVQTVSCEV